MKVLIISNMFPSKQKPYAGIFVLNQYKALKKEGLHVELFYMLRTFTSPLGSVIKYLRAFFRFIPRVFKRYDIVHLHYFFPLIIVAHLYKVFHPKSKLVVTFHGSDIKEKIQSKRNRKIFRFFTKKIDHAIAVGNDLSEDIKEKLDLRVKSVLSAGVDQNIFYRETGIQKEYDFIFVGSFIHRKGIDIVIDVIKKQEGKNISFCFVGSGPFLDELKSLQENYNVTILENRTQDELRILYNKSKFFLFPSRNEPFGLVATEALYCGTPIIVSTSGGLKEQLVEGKTGFFANTGEEILNVFQKVEKMRDEEYATLAQNAGKANKEYSLQNVVSELINIYKE